MVRVFTNKSAKRLLIKLAPYTTKYKVVNLKLVVLVLDN